MTEKFQILSARSHVRARTGMYLGSVSSEASERFVKGKWLTVKYVPAMFKCINEIIDNSIDEAIRTKFKHANKISVDIVMNEVTIEDNGRGIPQDLIVDEATGEEILRPIAAWTRVNSGTSFSDNRVTIGANGVGSAATNFVSSYFLGETWQKGKMVSVECENGAETVVVKTRAHTGSGTRVTFTPDYSMFEAESLTDHDLIELVEDRLINLQIAYPEIKFKFNGNELASMTFKDYAKMYHDSAILEQSSNLSFLISPSYDGFRSNCFINGVNTHMGGSYIEYIANGVVDLLVVQIKKKHKIDVQKNTIKAGFSLVVFARNFVDPKFDSQTKERLTSTLGKTKEHYEAAGVHDIDWLAKKILATPEIIDPIIQAQLARKAAEEKRKADALQKSLKKVKVAKHIAATGKDATLHLVEGDSAIGPAVAVRDSKVHGFFPLRGKVLNTWKKTVNQILENNELKELIAVLGLDANNKDSWKTMHYKYVNIMADADPDGLGHIAPLLITFFTRLWPDMVRAGRIRILRSPVLISSKGKDTKWFYDLDEANRFISDSKGWYHRYIKGLGSLEEDEYRTIINEPVVETIVLEGDEDLAYIEMMFGPNADARKQFIVQA